ncbi:uncharacterized protein LOC110446368 [Mizuhopecten yessoensis]|uniref:Uncharacterized protein n=1 Tax=Mizuhopecten yessoensis TaxID=6573 RepID=A0A210QXJ3_MIZYE|nr:uncharacterized protein LOC110446368 [Mizuhopecten yessoensis]OWF53450.1 hypothetical protein KP79_PYT22919 [Mizuhopecten yessoensis]
MTTRLLLLSLLVSAVVGQAKHGKDSSVCRDPTPPQGVNAIVKPTIPEQFSAHIECVIKNKNLTIDMHEFFDDINNRGVLYQEQDGVLYQAWYDYSINEFISYFPTYSLCTASKLSDSSQRFMFGYQTRPGQTGHIFSAGQALHFQTDAKEVYMGQSMVRGIAVDVWQSCQYWDTFDATMTVQWYFSASTEWDTAVGQPVPVGAYVKGFVWDTPTSTPRPIEHMYDIFHFRPSSPPDSIFQTPPGVLCTNRSNTKTVPSVPDAFSFTVEVVDKTLNAVSYMTEYYDSVNNFVRYTYRPSPTDNSPFGTNDLTEVHDFNTGVAYVTDQMHGNCTAMNIDLTFDGARNGATTLRLISSREFFYFNAINFTYEGVNKVRDIDADTWVGKRPNYPPGIGGVSTWQWYFTTNNWFDTNTGMSQGGVPIQMNIDAPNAGMSYEYHMFNFKNSVPNLLNYDVSACYIDRDRRMFQMKFPGQYTSVVDSNLDQFKYFVLVALTKTMSVSALRVSNLQVIFDKDIVVSFEVLDVAPILGDVTNHRVETPLDTAATKLINKIHSKQFFITMHFNNNQDFTGMIPMPKSLIETTYLWNSQTGTAIPQKTSGYGAGVMAAVGVVVPIVSAALGGVLAFFFFK